MSTDIVTVEDFARTIGLDVEIVRDRGTQVDKDGWEHHAYVLRLTRTGSTETIETPWSQGLGIESSPTEVPWDVLESLVMEARSAGQPFEDWADEYGYDTDSRKVYAMWLQIEAQAPALRTFLGDDYDTALELDV